MLSEQQIKVPVIDNGTIPESFRNEQEDHGPVPPDTPLLLD